LYVVSNATHLVFDTPPDFRDQVLNFGVERVDAVFLTHSHADHIFGFDDVRRFSTMQEKYIPVYGSGETIAAMRRKFDYVETASYGFESVPRVRFIEMDSAVGISSLTITPLPVFHGRQTIYGFLVEDGRKRLAYIPDCNAIPEETLVLLNSLDAMILDGLRPERHPTHFSILECVDMLDRIGAKRSFITHLAHNSDHNELQSQLGDAVSVPWDGLEIAL
jgi:phosphoribosyl 1,2-cyclic phosphate phosphodiesterase